MKRNIILGSALAIFLAAGSAVTALAAEAEDTSSYGYQAGQQQNSTRHASFTDAERTACFEPQGIGAQHLDTETLLEAGVIDQATADRIADAASQQHDLLHSRYGEKTEDLTPAERHAFYAAGETEDADNDPVDRLRNAGVITQEQADAIQAMCG